MQAVNLIVSCTNRKKAVIPDPLRARTLRCKSLSKRLEEWIRRRAAQEAQEYRASDLYAGDHWHVAQSIPREALGRGLSVRLWVCSAGYGLVRASDFLKPYSVTFASGHLDSITSQTIGEGNGSAASIWWSGLSDHPVSEGGLGSVAQLAASEPDVPLVIAASQVYLRAMAGDLAEAGAVLASNDLLSIVSSGTDADRLPSVAPWLLPADARFEAIVGGTRAALNARITRIMFQNHAGGVVPSQPRLCATLKRLSAKLPPLRRFDRRGLSDNEVRSFIERERQVDALVSKTALLRKLRARGFACEQGRFAEVFNQSSMSGSR